MSLSLHAEITALAADARRRSLPTRLACDAALAALKQGPLADLDPAARAQVVAPFVSACSSGHAKLVAGAIPALNRMLGAGLVPALELGAVVLALELACLVPDAHLRVLQCLPVIAQGHQDVDLLRLIHICATLAATKSPVVANSASATLQQLFNDLFDAIAKDGGDPTALIELDEPLLVTPLTAKGFAVFGDLCSLVSGEPTLVLVDFPVRPASVLEIIDNVLSSHPGLFSTPAFTHQLKSKLVPTLLAQLNDPEKSFPTTVRAMRILHTLLHTQLAALEIESEIVLLFLNHVLLGEADPINWEKALVLEIFKSLFADFANVRAIFLAYDAATTKKNVLRELLSIVLTFAQNNSAITSPTVAPPRTSTFLSAASNLKVPVLDHLDKSEPPAIPPTYTLHLCFRITCELAEGTSEFVANFQPNDPTLEASLDFVAALVSAVADDVHLLLQYFVYSAMDAESYHTLIRSLQRLTRTTGLIGLTDLQDRFLSLLSGAVINTQNTLDSEDAVSRSFNSRQVMCFRALASLAAALGSTFHESSWRLVWATFQWVDFYVNGPDEYSGHANSKAFRNLSDDLLPQVSPQDLQLLEAARAKVLDSVHDYLAELFLQLLTVTTSMLQEALDGGVCPYNRAYLLGQIVQIAKVDPTRYLLGHDASWSHFTGFFTTLAMNRLVWYNLRIHIVKAFNDGVLIISTHGFELNNAAPQQAASHKSLDALVGLLDGLFELGKAPELWILNCETEIHLLVLDTLHELIDKYDTYYQDSWDKVFGILSTSFRPSLADKKLDEKIKSLINSSFDTLKLILDEFLLTLPHNQLKILIDTLFNFCSQTYDLNISFSSVSYFWLISDSIESRAKGAPGTSAISIKTEQELVSYIEHSDITPVYYEVLNVYLLRSLARLSQDSRAQVRDGAIQTLFKIVHVHGQLIPDWGMVHDVVMPLLLDLTKIQGEDESKEWVDSASLMLSGLVSMFDKFVGNNLPKETRLALWRVLIRYLQEAVLLHWLRLNLKIFKSFNDLVVLLGTDVDEEVRQLVFQFWTLVPIEYDFVDLSSQETYAVMMECYGPLSRILGAPSLEESHRILALFNQCARYPCLPSHQLDDKKPTKLQQLVLDNLKVMESGDAAIQLAIIQQLTSILVYPFGTRERIQRKLHSKLSERVKIPTFVAASHQALGLIRGKLAAVESLQTMIDDHGVEKLMRALLEVVQHKAAGLWHDANDLLYELIGRLASTSLPPQVWDLVLASITICFDNNSPEEEGASIAQYRRLSATVVPVMEAGQVPQLDTLVREVYKMSFLYEASDDEQRLIDKGASSFVQYDFDSLFGLASECVVRSNRHLRLECLRDLITFSTTESTQSLFLVRAAFTLRRFIADAKLLNKAPLPAVQRDELLIILRGLQQVTPEPLRPLLVKSVRHQARVPGIDSLLESVLDN